MHVLELAAREARCFKERPFLPPDSSFELGIRTGPTNRHSKETKQARASIFVDPTVPVVVNPVAKLISQPDVIAIVVASIRELDTPRVIEGNANVLGIVPVAIGMTDSHSDEIAKGIERAHEDEPGAPTTEDVVQVPIGNLRSNAAMGLGMHLSKITGARHRPTAVRVSHLPLQARNDNGN